MCDLERIIKDLQHINYSLILKLRENLNCCGQTLSQADNEGDKNFNFSLTSLELVFFETSRNI